MREGREREASKKVDASSFFSISSHEESSLSVLVSQQKSTISSLEQELEDLHKENYKWKDDYATLSVTHSNILEEYEKTKLSLQNELIRIQAELSQANEGLRDFKTKISK